MPGPRSAFEYAGWGMGAATPPVRRRIAGYTRAVRFGLRSSLVALVAIVAIVVSSLACERPPIGAPDEPPPPGRVGPIALETFTQDRPAIAGKWFEYDPDGHTLTPKDEAWVLRASTGEHAAFRITDIYESDAAESGLFTFGVSTFDAASATWSAEAEWVTPRNIKTTGQMCVDLFAQTELACDDDVAWHLRLALFQYFSPLAGIAVAEPGVFVHDGFALVARVDGMADLAALAAAVPDPAALEELDDQNATSWQSTDWAFDKLAPNLPRAGMAIGQRFGDARQADDAGEADVYWMMTARFDLVRFSVQLGDGDADGDGDVVDVTFSSVEADREDWTAPDTMPEPTSVTVPVPAAGDGTWLTFTTPDLLLEPDNLVDTSWPHAPPKTNRFDLAVEHAPDGAVRILVSPGAAVLNATQLGLDDLVPPVSE